jgi:nucleoside 2-deoxyribosyltransferase
VVNTHKDLDYITSWELGYAMGKGLKIIGYFDGNNAMEIPKDVERLIRPIPSDVARFVNIISRALEKLEPKEYPLEEEGWNKQHQSAKKEAEATL